MENRQKIEKPEIKAEIGRPVIRLDLGKGPVAAIAALALLILLAVLAGLAPTALRGSEKGIATNVTPETPVQGTPIDLTSLANASPSVECKSMLVQGGERDSYAYMMTISSGQNTSHVALASNFSAIGEGYIRTVNTTIASPEVNATMLEIHHYDSTLKCTYAESYGFVLNHSIVQNISCSDATSFKICADQLVEVGTDRVTVGAGTFDTREYQSTDNSTKYWVANLSVPIKISLRTAVLELESFEKWKG